MRDIHDVTDDIFKVFESIKAMFAAWNSEKQAEFIMELRKLDGLEKELQEITGNWDQSHLIVVGIYRSIFPTASLQRITPTTTRAGQSLCPYGFRCRPIIARRRSCGIASNICPSTPFVVVALTRAL